MGNLKIIFKTASTKMLYQSNLSCQSSWFNHKGFLKAGGDHINLFLEAASVEKFHTVPEVFENSLIWLLNAFVFYNPD
jgi:hypothetical protein